MMRFPRLQRSPALILSALVAIAGCDGDPVVSLEPAAPYRPATLLEAVLLQDADAVRGFLAGGIDVNTPEIDGTTPLMRAIHGGSPQIAELLIAAGADVTAANRYGVNPLYLAARERDAASTRALLAAGADPNTALPEGETVLMTAARIGSPEIVALLLRGAEVGGPNVLPALGSSGYGSAAQPQGSASPRRLGADPNAKERWHGQTALMWAAAGGHAEIVRLLIEAGAFPDERSAPSDTPDADASDAPNGRSTALHFAARGGHVEALRALLDGGADSNAMDAEGRTAALLAVTNGHLPAARLLLEAGTDPKLADRFGRTVLFAAVARNAVAADQPSGAASAGDVTPADIVMLALAKGADPDAPLSRSPPNAQRAVEPNPILDKGATALLRAAMSGDVEIMRILLAAGADPRAATDERPPVVIDGLERPSNGKTTALMAAAGVGWQEAGTPGRETAALATLELLLEHGADVNAANQAGDTALHGAALRGSTAIIQFLADHGANLQIKNAKGYTALDIASGIPSERIPYNEATARLLRQLAQRS